MKRLLDVDYLLTRPTLPGTIIYLYRSGVLRRAMLAVLSEVAIGEGRLLHTCNPISLLSGTSDGALWDPFPVCDWERNITLRPSDGELDVMLQGLATRADQRFALFVPVGSQLTKQSAWSHVEATVSIVEELAISRETLLPALRYLEATTDLADKPEFTAKEGFVARFEDMLHDIPDLPALMRAFDDVVVTSTDARTNDYDQRDHRRAMLHQRGRASPLACLRALIAKQTGWDGVRLVATLDVRRWINGRTKLKVLADLYRSTTYLLKDGRDASVLRKTSAMQKQTIDIVLWAAMLLALEDDLMPKAVQGAVRPRQAVDGLVPDLDRLMRTFIARRDEENCVEPLSGLWAGFELTLTRVASRETSEFGISREMLVRALAETLMKVPQKSNVRWLLRLKASLVTAVSHADAAHCELDALLTKQVGACASTTLRVEHVPETFDEIIGHQHVVDALRARVQSAKHYTGLLLYGPEGVGKHTLARLYAKAVLCKTPTLRGGACNTCSACQEFDRGGGFGYAYADVAGNDADHRAHELVRVAQTASFSQRVVLLIANVDQCQPKAFDVLLKTLETPPPGVTFVLLGRELRGMRLAGQSRCMVYRLRPLPWKDARVYLSAELAAAGVIGDEQVLDALTAETQGMFKQMHAAAQKIVALPTVTMTSVRTALDHDWIGGIAAFWQAAFAENEPLPEALMPLATDDPIKALRRVQAILLRLQPNSLGPQAPVVIGQEAALQNQDEVIDDLTIGLQRRADALGLDASAIWRAFAWHWLSRDHSTAEGLR